MSAEARLQARQDRSAPLIAAFEVWLNANRARVSSKAPLGEALKYIARYWDGLCLFMDDGRVEMDNNAVERTIRPIALNRNYAKHRIMHSGQWRVRLLRRARHLNLHIITGTEESSTGCQ